MTSITNRLATALFVTVIAAAPALAQTVTIDYDHSVNFLKFKTYTWQKLHATDPSVEDRINIALKRDMEGRYMTEVASGGDVTITAVEATKDKAEFAASTPPSAASPGSRSPAPTASSMPAPPCRTFPSTPSSSTCTTARPTNSSGAEPSLSRSRPARTRTTAPSTTPSPCSSANIRPSTKSPNPWAPR